MKDIFTFADSQSLRQVKVKYKMKIFVILSRFLEPKTKRELRKIAFSFLLKILDSYEAPSQADPEFISLFNFALDNDVLRVKKGKPIYKISIT